MPAQIKPNLADMTEKLQVNDVQRRQPVVVRCCLKNLSHLLYMELYHYESEVKTMNLYAHEIQSAEAAASAAVAAMLDSSLSSGAKAK